MKTSDTKTCLAKIMLFLGIDPEMSDEEIIKKGEEFRKRKDIR